LINSSKRILESPEKYSSIGCIHPNIGAKILKQIKLSKDIVPTAKRHYENDNGNSFPFGLGRDNIPLDSRIIAVVEDYIKITYN